MSTFKKYPKSWAILITFVVLGVLAVSGDGFADLANKPFWWHFWSISGVVSFIIIIAAWVWAFANRNKDIQE